MVRVPGRRYGADASEDAFAQGLSAKGPEFGSTHGIGQGGRESDSQDRFGLQRAGFDAH